jgi:hypothetical protein
MDLSQFDSELVPLNQGGVVRGSTARLLLLHFHLAKPLPEPTHGLLHAVAPEGDSVHLALVERLHSPPRIPI